MHIAYLLLSPTFAVGAGDPRVYPIVYHDILILVEQTQGYQIPTSCCASRDEPGVTPLLQSMAVSNKFDDEGMKE